jgi:hypothetical protein
MKESRSEALWNEEMVRCGTVVFIAERMMEARLRNYIECNEETKEDGQKHYGMFGSSHSEKVKEALLRWYGHVIRKDEEETLWNENIRRCGMADISKGNKAVVV